LRARGAKQAGMERVEIRGTLHCSPKTFGDGGWVETGKARLYVNLSRHVRCATDASAVLDVVPGGALVHIAVDVGARVRRDAALHVDLMLETTNGEGLPCWCKSGSTAFALHHVRDNVGHAIAHELYEVSDPDVKRGSIKFDIQHAAFEVDAGAVVEPITRAAGRQLALQGLQWFYTHAPTHARYKLIHTPTFNGHCPGGFYSMTAPHAASPEAVWAQLARVAAARLNTPLGAVVEAVEAQRALGPDATTLANGMRRAATVLAYTATAVANAMSYMSDHKAPARKWPFVPAVDQAACEQFFSAARVTGADDCEGLAHEIGVAWEELRNGPGAMHADAAVEWRDPLVRALGYIARHGYTACMTTWAVSAAAMDGRAQDADASICHIASTWFPNARLQDMTATSGMRYKEAAQPWTALLPVLVAEGTGYLHPLLDAADVEPWRNDVAKTRLGIEAAVPGLDSYAPMLFGHGEKLTSFYQALISAFVPRTFAHGVVDLWFGNHDGTWGVTTRDVVRGNCVAGPCLQMSDADFVRCETYARGTTVPPALKPACTETPAHLRTLLDTFHDGAPAETRAVTGWYDYFIRSELFSAALPTFARARQHCKGMTAVLEPLVGELATVRIRMWPK
jgi:hypothetical protein